LRLAVRLAILGTRGIPARYGGFETFAEKLASGLAARGHEVTVYCEGSMAPFATECCGARLKYVAAPALGPLSTIAYDAMCLWDARKDFDVVYMLGYGAAPFCVLPRLWGAEVWINPDGIEWAREKWNFFGRTYLRIMEWVSLRVASRMIADADAIAADLGARHGKLGACTTIAYGCEVVESPPPAVLLGEWSLTAQAYYLLVCRLERENHVLEILEAFQRSKSRRAIIVVGNHHAKTRYVKQILGVRDPRIRMIGAVYDQRKLTALRSHAFAYMHGHSVGGTNPSLLEAIGCGNLVLAHDNPFNREVLGAAGIFFSCADDLARAIDNVERRDQSSLDELRETARRRARANYRWEDVIEKYAALLGEGEAGLAEAAA
jgi:glycosyltransferase involved in cell wall biosynthesis